MALRSQDRCLENSSQIARAGNFGKVLLVFRISFLVLHQLFVKLEHDQVQSGIRFVIFPIVSESCISSEIRHVCNQVVAFL